MPIINKIGNFVGTGKQSNLPPALNLMSQWFDGTIENNLLIDKKGVRNDTPLNGYSLGVSTTTTFTISGLPVNYALMCNDPIVTLPLFTTSGNVITFIATGQVYWFKILVDNTIWGEYPICESVGTVLYDVSGNNHNITVSLGNGTGWTTQTIVNNYCNIYGYSINSTTYIPALKNNNLLNALGGNTTYVGRARFNAKPLDASFIQITTNNYSDIVYIDFNPNSITEKTFELFNRSNIIYFSTGMTIYNSKNYVFAKTDFTTNLYQSYIQPSFLNKLFFGNNKILVYTLDQDPYKVNISLKTVNSKLYELKTVLGDYINKITHTFSVKDLTKINFSTFKWKDYCFDAISLDNTGSNKPVLNSGYVDFASSKDAFLNSYKELGRSTTFMYYGTMPSDNGIVFGNSSPQNYLVRNLAANTYKVNDSGSVSTFNYTFDSNPHLWTVLISYNTVTLFVDGVIIDSVLKTDRTKTYLYKFISSLGGVSYYSNGKFTGFSVITKAILSKYILNNLTSFISNGLSSANHNYSFINIVYIGDSITYGQGLTENQTFPYLIKQALGPHVQYSKLGYSGYASNEIIQNYSNELSNNYIKEIPNILVEFCGANDIARDYAPQQIYNCKKGIHEIAHSIGYKTIVVGVLPRQYTQNSGNEHLTSWNGINSLLRSDHSFADGFVDIALDTTIGVQGSETNTTYYQDQTHPTAAGNIILKNNILPIIQSLL